VLTYEQADEIFMASEFADELDDVVSGNFRDPADQEANELEGYLYQLKDGSLVVVRHDGTVVHEHEGRPWMEPNEAGRVAVLGGTVACPSCEEPVAINPHTGCCDSCADAAYDAACPCLPEIHSAEWVDRMEEIDASMGPI